MNKKLSAFVAVAALVWAGLTGTASAMPVGTTPRGIDRFGHLKHPVLATSLLDDAGLLSAPVAGLSTETPDVDAAGRIKIEIRGERDTVAAAVADVGGTIDVGLPERSTAFVPKTKLRELAEVHGITQIREPLRAIPDVVTSQGVTESGALAWQTAGQSGAGVKIAILDVGFADYAAKVTAGEVPDIPAANSNNQCTNINAEGHGTAVMETVYDMAPAATYFRICIDDDLDIVNAAGFITSKGINIVNASFGNPRWGRGDGSGGAGTVPAVVRAHRQAGILWVVSAGNDALNHTTLTPSGSDFVFSRPDFQYPLHLAQLRPGGDYTLGFTVPASCSVATVIVKWDSWPVTDVDFDAFILDGPNPVTANVVGGSAVTQNGSQTPTEFAGVLGPGVTANFYLVIDRYSSAANPRFDLTFQCVSALEFSNAAGSVSVPASSPYVMTAGAHHWGSGVTEAFSSRGPTIDGRVKPDISGPDGTANSVYGAFFGTSAAAPHVTGAAAILKGANATLDPAELQQILESRAQDFNAAGKDNDAGAGRLRLGDPALGTPAPPAGHFFTPLATPVRLLDTRNPCSATNPKCTNFAPGEQFNLTVAGMNGVPPAASAVVLNVTVAGSTGAGWLTIWPTGGIAPTASSLNFEAGQVVANSVTATLGGGQVSIMNSSPGTTPIIVDLAGFYAPTGTSGFIPLNPPRRALDTRTSVGGHQVPLASGEDIAVTLANTTIGGTVIPAGVTAVALNVTVTGPTQHGWITVYPNGVTRPTVSSLNFTAGLTVANLVIAKIGTNNKVRFYNSNGNTHLIIDVVGYYLPGSGGHYVALSPPSRDLDTRSGNGDLRDGVPHPRPFGGGETYALQMDLLYGVPSDATAAVLNVTAVFPSAIGWLTVYPTGFANPGTSSLNFFPGKIVPNAVMTSIGSDGKINIFNSGGATHVISDLAGYFV